MKAPPLLDQLRNYEATRPDQSFWWPKNCLCYVKFIPLMHYANLSSHMTIEMTERAHSTHCGLAIEKIVQKKCQCFLKNISSLLLRKVLFKKKFKKYLN